MPPEGLNGDVGCAPLPPEAPLFVDGVRTDVEPFKPFDRSIGDGGARGHLMADHNAFQNRP
jgi:hypothetical protein